MDLRDLDNGINNNGVDLNYDLNLKMNWAAKGKFVHKKVRPKSSLSMVNFGGDLKNWTEYWIDEISRLWFNSVKKHDIHERRKDKSLTIIG